MCGCVDGDHGAAKGQGWECHGREKELEKEERDKIKRPAVLGWLDDPWPWESKPSCEDSRPSDNDICGIGGLTAIETGQTPTPQLHLIWDGSGTRAELEGLGLNRERSEAELGECPGSILPKSTFSSLVPWGYLCLDNNKNKKHVKILS